MKCRAHGKCVVFGKGLYAMAKNMFITDFDGVLCDSVLECLLVTSNAYGKLQSSSYQRKLSLEDITPARREEFRRLRSFLKGAEDFIPMFIAIEKDIKITVQKDFDVLKADHHQQLPKYLEAFYAERDFLQQNEKELWFSLNPLFDGLREALKQRESFEGLHILTTKRQNDVVETFQYQGIPFPADQITYMKSAGKSQKLLKILQENEAVMEESMYFEDQVDFLVESKKHRIGSYLVEWGYVSIEQKELAQQHEIPIIDVQTFKDILRRFQVSR